MIISTHRLSRFAAGVAVAAGLWSMAAFAQQNVSSTPSKPLLEEQEFRFPHGNCARDINAGCTPSNLLVVAVPSLASSAGSGPVAPGTHIIYHVIASNDGPAAVDNFNLTLPLRDDVICPLTNRLEFRGSITPSREFTVNDLKGPGIVLPRLSKGESVTFLFACETI